MTHEELIAKIDSKIIKNETIAKYSEVFLNRTDESWKALRAVVELHKPALIFKNETNHKVYCECGAEYPCPTIQAIEKELG